MESEKIETILDANQLKEKGNQLFKEADFEAACENYEAALRISTEDTQKAILECNAGLCCIKMHKFIESISHLDSAIKLNPSYIKPYMHRSKAYAEQDNYDKAIEDIKSLLALEPLNDIALSTLKEYNEKNKVKQDKVKTEALGTLKDLGNKILGNFGISIDNFKMNQNQDGSYNIQYQNK